MALAVSRQTQPSPFGPHQLVVVFGDRALSGVQWQLAFCQGARGKARMKLKALKHLHSKEAPKCSPRQLPLNFPAFWGASAPLQAGYAPLAHAMGAHVYGHHTVSVLADTLS